jgi:acetyl-CoA decarbonylase/synthase complex subunit gamma
MTWRDRVSTLRVRLGIGRMNYRVQPGVYALGRPTSDSPVLVSANFKLSVDHLRGAVSRCISLAAARYPQDVV